MSNKPSFWADQIAQQAIEKNSYNLVCTGITPSGHIHIGNMREVLSGDAVYRAILDQKGKADLMYIGDTYDALRRVYPFLDEKTYTPMIGKPLSDIPCPCGKHASYSDHFLEPFLAAMKELGLDIKVTLADQMYKTGKYTDSIMTALEKRDKIAEILTQQTGKEIAPDWSPVNPKCDNCGRITAAKVLGFDTNAKTVSYECDCGHKGEADATTGGAKLTWRVDWPARWAILGVTVEPFGKDHASRGGSYDTGRLIAKEIFNYQAPTPVIYEWISLKGQGDMSSSKGNVVSISDMLEVVPPDVLRYMIFRTKPKKAIVFNPGLPMLSLVDELDNEENNNRDPRAYELSLVSGDKVVGIPFKHLVNIVQIARDDEQQALNIIERGGYEIKHKETVLRRLQYAEKWLKNYAPEDMKFAPLDEMPSEAKDFNETVKKALAFIADKLTPEMSGEDIHTLFYGAKAEVGIEPKELFQAIYISLIGKERGPRAGWFIATLGVPFVKARFQEVASS